MKYPCALLVALFTVTSAAIAVANSDPDVLAHRRVSAARRTGEIQIDGALDEQAWAAAPIADHFVQSRPAPGHEATLATEARILYDDDAIYVGVRLRDPTPGAIAAPLGRRDDENNSDWCFVEFDSRHDRRTGFSFGINPAGLQVDGVFYNDVEWDTSWNAVWEGAARVDDQGWTAEFRIPLSQLAFDLPASDDPMLWGLNVFRSTPHAGEVSNWSPRTPDRAAVVSRFNELEVGAPPGMRRLELTPYLSFELKHRAGDQAPAVRGGIDLRAGLSSWLALTATVLPDFGQVEADPTQLNLTTFELFQTERRPFFTEGLDAFRFDTGLALTSRDDSFGDEAPFYSRRIGRAPQGALPEGATATSAPAAATLLGALKLFGRSRGGWRFGVLGGWTRREVAEIAGAPDGATTWPIEPATQAIVARVARESATGDSATGLFASVLHRQLDDAPLAAQLVGTATTVGGDARQRWHDDDYEARAWALATDQRGTTEAISRLGAQPWHRFDRVDAPRLRLTTGATRLDGAAGEARVAKIGGGLQGAIATRAISPGYDVNALGFQRNSDWLLLAGQWRYQVFPSTSWLRFWQVGSDNLALGWSWGGERRATAIDAYGSLYFANYWDATIGVQHEPEVLSTEWLRGGPALRLPARESARASIHTDTRRATSASLDLSASMSPGDGSWAASVAPSAFVRISDMVAANVAATFADQRVGWQYVAGPGVAPPSTYLVARDRQRTAAATAQLDVALSPHFIIQLYARPFATQGRYDRYALLADARAGSASDRFTSLGPDELTVTDTTVMVRSPAAWQTARPDGSTTSVDGGAVVRWEVRPGSFFTAVATHQQGVDVAMLKLDWRLAL